MRNLQSILSGRVSAISARVVIGSSARRGRKSQTGKTPPGYRALSAKLARASERVRGARHGRGTA